MGASQSESGRDQAAPQTADNGADWTKKAAIFISILALLATGSSAFAALQSWRTARAAEDVARQSLLLSGAVPEVVSTVEFNGSCGAGQELNVEVVVENSGRIATTVKRAEFAVDYVSHHEFGGGGGGSSGNWAPVPIAFSRDLNIAVPPEDQATVSLPINCKAVTDVLARPNFEAVDLVDLIDGKAVTLPPYGGGGGQRSVTAAMYTTVSFGTGEGSTRKAESASTR